MEDRKKALFLLQMYELADKELNQYIFNLNSSKETMVNQAASSLSKALDTVLEKYKNLQCVGKVEELQWVYLSFMRTGYINLQSFYRIDCYDRRDCSSDVECAVNWDFSAFSSCISAIKNRLESEFKKQTYVREYELDNILFIYIDKLFEEAKTIFPQILENALVLQRTI